MAKLNREKNWRTHRKGRAKAGKKKTRAVSLGMRVSKVRRLEVNLGRNPKRKGEGAILAKLVLATPDVVGLRLNIGGQTFDVRATLPALEVALRGLQSLRELSLYGMGISADHLLRVLNAVLPKLEVLDLQGVLYKCTYQLNDALLRQIKSPNLCKICIHLSCDYISGQTHQPIPVANRLFSRLATTIIPGKLRSLHLTTDTHDTLTTLVSDLIQRVNGLVHFTWRSGVRDNLEKDSRVAIHQLLRAMESLIYLETCMWKVAAPQTDDDQEEYDMGVVDGTILETLATLRNLQTLKLQIPHDNYETFDESTNPPFAQFIRSSPSLRVIWLIKKTRLELGTLPPTRKGLVLPAVYGGDIAVEWA
ncbi:hypothetical protein P7C70_g8176, partial [Phenoliferia sp. Uapishka_3]